MLILQTTKCKFWTCRWPKKFWLFYEMWIRYGFPLFSQGHLTKIPLFLKEFQNMVSHMITAGRVTFARHWKSDSIPPTEEWIMKCNETILAIKLTFFKRWTDIFQLHIVWETFFSRVAQLK